MRPHPLEAAEKGRVYKEARFYSEQGDLHGLFRVVIRGHRLQIISSGSDPETWQELEWPLPVWEPSVHSED